MRRSFVGLLGSLVLCAPSSVYQHHLYNSVPPIVQSWHIKSFCWLEQALSFLPTRRSPYWVWPRWMAKWYLPYGFGCPASQHREFRLLHCRRWFDQRQGSFYPSRYITSRWPSQNLGSSNTQTRLSSPGFTPQFKKRVHLLLGTHDISNVATLEQFTRDYNVGNHSSFSNKGYRFVLLDSISLSSRATGWRVRTMNAPICSHIDQGGRPVLQTMVRNRCKLRHQLSGAMGRLRRVWRTRLL